MATVEPKRGTLDDLMQTEGKVQLIRRDDRDVPSIGT